MNTKVKLPGLELDFPVYNGSGSFEYGDYQWTKIDFDNLPALTLKTSTLQSNITPEKRENLMNFRELTVINSIGLQNPPVDKIVLKIREFKTRFAMPLIASAAADSVADFAKNVEILSQEDVVAVEINLSCPNIEKGTAFGTDPMIVEETVRAIKAKTKKPIYVKLTPAVTDITAIAKAAERGGADAIVAINSMIGYVVDPKDGKPLLAKGYGGYSGPGIFPIALRAIHQIYQVVKIPIIGVGGVTTAQNAIDMMSVGATAVQVVSGIGPNYHIFRDIKQGFKQYMAENQIDDINQIIGRTHKFDLKKLYPDTYLKVQK